MKDVKKWLQSKIVIYSAVMSALVVGLAGAACAETVTSETVQTAFSTGFQAMANDALSMVAVIVPIALGVAGVIWLARKALSWFRSMAK